MNLEEALRGFHAQLRAGDITSGYQRLEQQLQQHSSTPQDWQVAMQAMLQAAVPGAAAALAEQALSRFPHDLDLRCLFGNALRMTGEIQAAERELRAVLSTQPQHQQAAVSLAHLLRGEGRMHAAVTVMIEHLPAAPASAVLLAAIAFVRECDQPRQAMQLVQQGLAQDAENPELHSIAGELALELGRFEQARVQFRRALSPPSHNERGWLQLATTHRFVSSDDPDYGLLIQARQRDDLADLSRAAVHFALAKADADLGRLEEATVGLRAANRIMRRVSDWSANGYQAFVDGQIARPLPVTVSRVPELQPVLIVGLPRTGTTLAASLLGQHPQVKVRGELNWLSGLAVQIEAAGRDPAQMNQAASIYASQLHRDDEPVHCYVDKNPLNFRHLGLAEALLPNLRIIHCVRDARATALSLWRQMFAHEDNGYAYDFRDIASFARGERQLMQHWRDVLQRPFFELHYEALVSDTPAILRQLHEFLDLDAATEAITKQVDPGSVRTASVWQVRQRIHTDAIAAWRDWLPYVPELTENFSET